MNAPPAMEFTACTQAHLDHLKFIEWHLYKWWVFNIYFNHIAGNKVLLKLNILFPLHAREEIQEETCLPLPQPVKLGEKLKHSAWILCRRRSP